MTKLQEGHFMPTIMDCASDRNECFPLECFGDDLGEINNEEDDCRRLNPPAPIPCSDARSLPINDNTALNGVHRMRINHCVACSKVTLSAFPSVNEIFGDPRIRDHNEIMYISQGGWVV